MEFTDDYISEVIDECFIEHHGIKGQKWGDQNGPPYPLDPSKDYSKRELRQMRKAEKKKLKQQEKMKAKRKKVRDELKLKKEKAKLKAMDKIRADKDADLSMFSDKEIMDLVNRIQVEEMYNNAIYKKKADLGQHRLEMAEKYTGIANKVIGTVDNVGKMLNTFSGLKGNMLKNENQKLLNTAQEEKNKYDKKNYDLLLRGKRLENDAKEESLDEKKDLRSKFGSSDFNVIKALRTKDDAAEQKRRWDREDAGIAESKAKKAKEEADANAKAKKEAKIAKKEAAKLKKEETERTREEEKKLKQARKDEKKLARMEQEKFNREVEEAEREERKEYDLRNFGVHQSEPYKKNGHKYVDRYVVSENGEKVYKYTYSEKDMKKWNKKNDPLENLDFKLGKNFDSGDLANVVYRTPGLAKLRKAIRNSK